MFHSFHAAFNISFEIAQSSLMIQIAEIINGISIIDFKKVKTMIFIPVEVKEEMC